MCGITGFWGPAGPEQGFRQVLESMCRALRHRGPDDQGWWCDPEAGLGLAQTRLSIVDLSPAGRQPMHSADGRYVLVYNGEAYNFPEVRRELEQAGLAPEWNSTGDTETVLAAVAAWGLTGALERLVGMFALALWDRAERTLTLVRDRMGIKPLYYGYAGRSLVFASEMSALRRHPDWRGGVDPDALSLYLRYLYVPAPATIHPGIRKLEPGCLTRFTMDQVGSAVLPGPVRWWSVLDQVEQGLADPLQCSEEEAADELERLLTDAVRLRLVSDVPLGAFLSGGVDSSTVAALMQGISPGRVKTFSIGSADADYDEARYARAVAGHLGTDHTELVVEEEQAREVIPLLPRMFDEPFADASQIPTFLVSRLARRTVTVSLSGDGGDELFGGYNRHILAPGLWERLGRMPGPVRSALGSGLRLGGERALAAAYGLLEPLLPAARRQAIFRDKVQKVADAMAAPDRAAFYTGLCSFWKDGQGLVPGSSGGLPDPDPDGRLEGLDFASWMMAADQVSYLPNDILAKVDRASMAVSLEARVPLLDHRVVALAWRLPLAMKIADGKGKLLLRRVLYRHVPRELIERPKQGFGVPLHQWLRGPLRHWAEGLLDGKRLAERGLILPGPVRRAWAEHLAGRRNNQYHLWAVLMFQAWLEEWGE